MISAADQTREIRLTMTDREASELMYLMMNNVDWADDLYGTTARSIYLALEAVDIQEA